MTPVSYTHLAGHPKKEALAALYDFQIFHHEAVIEFHAGKAHQIFHRFDDPHAYIPVSYTHLDVYKRQVVHPTVKVPLRPCLTGSIATPVVIPMACLLYTSISSSFIVSFLCSSKKSVVANIPSTIGRNRLDRFLKASV